MRRMVRTLGVMALMAVSAPVGACGGSDAEEGGSGDPSEATSGVAAGAEVPAAGTSTAPAVTEVVIEPVSAPIELVQPEPVPVAPPFPVADTDGVRVMTRSLEPWRDGFLAVGEVVELQRLPDELPEEIASQFPPEISELFPDGLPDTLDEALAVIDGAGMRDEVVDAVESIPGAYEAIFSVGLPARKAVFAWSVDGSVWERLDADVPAAVAFVDDVVTAGDRLVIAGRDTTIGFGNATLSVAETTDLVEWHVNVIEPQRPPDLPADVELDVWTASLVANELGWVLEATVTADLQGEDVSDPSPQLEPYLRPGGWGPWQVPNHWFAPWAGETIHTDPGGAGHPTGDNGLLAATNGGYLYLTDTAYYSENGSTWTSVSEFTPPARVDYWTSFSQPLPDGIVVYLGGSMAPVMYRVSDDATEWEPLAFPELPSDLGPAQISLADEYVFDTNNWSGTIEQWVIASPDGARFFADHFNTVSSGNYRVGVAAIHAGTLLVGLDEMENETTEWWRHVFAD